MDGFLKVGVVGAGVFGNYHAGKVAGHERTVLTGLFDSNPERAAEVAERHEGVAFETLEALIEASDALVVASPATQHASACFAALAQKKHLLVEKPISPNPELAEDIVKLARSQGCVLQVGHQERVVTSAIGLDGISDRPISVEIIRHSPRSNRNRDTSVVMDLMIHDLDLILWLFGDPQSVQTQRAVSLYSDHLDAVNVSLIYPDMTVTLSASRDAALQRYWKLSYQTGEILVDFGNKTINNDTDYDLDAGFGERPEVKDSLATAFDHFVCACLDGESPLVPGQDGLAAVRLAESIEREV